MSAAFILGAALVAGSVAGTVASVAVYWVTAETLIKRSPYRNHANGHLLTRTR